MAALVTSGSVDALLVGGDTTAGLSAGMVLTSDAQNAFPSGTVINTVTDATHLALSVAASKTTGPSHLAGVLDHERIGECLPSRWRR